MTTNAFLAALQAKGSKINADVRQATPGRAATPPAPTTTPIDDTPLEVRIDRVLSNRRLDVYFSRKPDREILTALRDHGWRYNPTMSCWYHRDDEDNRLFCDIKFGAQFDDPAPAPVSYPDRALITYDDTPAVTSGEAEKVAEVAIDAATESPEWTRYRSQVDALLHSTGMTPADLMIHAIDYLYRHTIAQ